MHLLTKEAFAIYRRHVKPDGVFAVHISNRHLNLRPVIAALAQTLGLRVMIVGSNIEQNENGEYSSVWAMMGSSPKLPAPQKHQILWTDDTANLLGVLK